MGPTQSQKTLKGEINGRCVDQRYDMSGNGLFCSLKMEERNHKSGDDDGFRSCRRQGRDLSSRTPRKKI